MQPIITEQNKGIMYRRWQAESTDACFLLVHGLGAQTKRWAPMAEYFLAQNISSYALELKGFGETQALQGHVDSFDVYYQDIQALHQIVVQENRGKDIFLVAESMGALISFRLVQKCPQLFKGFVGISPAFSSRMKFPITDYLKLIWSLIVNPRKQFIMSFNSQMCTADIDYRKVLDEEPLEHRFASAKLVIETVKAQIVSLVSKNNISIPILFQTAGKDELVNPADSEKVFKKLQIEKKRIIHYPDMKHSLSIEQDKEKVFEDIVEWVKDVKG